MYGNYASNLYIRDLRPLILVYSSLKKGHAPKRWDVNIIKKIFEFTKFSL